MRKPAGKAHLVQERRAYGARSILVESDYQQKSKNNHSTDMFSRVGASQTINFTIFARTDQKMDKFMQDEKGEAVKFDQLKSLPKIKTNRSVSKSKMESSQRPLGSTGLSQKPRENKLKIIMKQERLDKNPFMISNATSLTYKKGEFQREMDAKKNNSILDNLLSQHALKQTVSPEKPPISKHLPLPDPTNKSTEAASMPAHQHQKSTHSSSFKAVERDRATPSALKLLTSGHDNFAKYKPNYSPVERRITYKNVQIDNGLARRKQLASVKLRHPVHPSSSLSHHPPSSSLNVPATTSSRLRESIEPEQSSRPAIKNHLQLSSLRQPSGRKDIVRNVKHI